jgi:lysyl-tRNA synthetase class 2
MKLEQLMDEVEALVQAVFAAADSQRTAAVKIERLSYRALFETHFAIDPHRVSLDELAALAEQTLDLVAADLSRTDYLQLLLSHCIEPTLPDACFIFDYPVAQAALARVEDDETGQPVARRFELFLGGMEVANGYFEQRARFDADIAERARRGFDQVPIDEALLAALAAGMPECSGVALGVDRLVMAALGIDDIAGVIAFPQPRT